MKSWKWWCVVVGLTVSGQISAAEPQKITALERSQGWQMLFDGKSLVDWRGYQQNKVPKNWRVVDGSLVTSGGTPLVTEKEFGDFELLFDWKVSEGGSAEVFFRVDEEVDLPGNSGPVMKLAGEGVEMGSNGFASPTRKVTLQNDVWYRTKIVVFGNQVDYLDGSDRIASFMIDSADWRAAVAGSLLKQFKEFGKLRGGRVVISGTNATFRNIKIKKL
ncbi:3-keto-disaccharide hydrolase [Oleiharenicola lentus]|uniref:3-keto-disaccharide hydrolase n=1 Tax=Oleiharenicola lentus TaxID=2508720 RepID=UPI003F67EBFE